MGLVLLILILLLVFGGGGGYYGYTQWGGSGRDWDCRSGTDYPAAVVRLRRPPSARVKRGHNAHHN
jgi:hypothetical protein